MKPLKNARVHCPEGGFTLPELLASLAIIALLAVLLTAPISRWRSQASSLQCVTNLRQVGMAMALFVQDNEGNLPGPLWRGQSPYSQISSGGEPDLSSGNLASFLAPYLHTPARASGDSFLNASFSCPAWQSSPALRQHTICYYSAGEIRLADEEPVFPFGRAGENPIPPIRLASLERPAETPAFWEFDRTMRTEGFYVTDPRVPAAPVHQKFRHLLYFDGHAVAQLLN